MPHATITAEESRTVNVGARLTETAKTVPENTAVVVPKGREPSGKRRYETISFRELDTMTDRMAAGLQGMGVTTGTRMVLLVPPSIEFIALTFALFKAGAVTVLIDPGMGRRNLVRCLADVEPRGFVAIPVVQAIRSVLRRRFRSAKLNVTVGRRWLWGGRTLEQLKAVTTDEFKPPLTQSSDPAAIIFTTGSTGPPKGVLYRHGNFDRQVDEIRERFGIESGEVDLAGFPLFGLFNGAMGVTTVIPDMDPTRPAKVNPKNIVEAVRDWNVTQAFGSPAIWNAVGRYCEDRNERLESVRRVLSAGAPVPPHVLRRMTAAIHTDGEMHTPYGATEALPVASSSASDVLDGTERETSVGKGTCVGTRFPGIQWKVIKIDDGPIATIGDVEELATSEIGELVVSGDVVTREYVTRTEANALAKIQDVNRIWHRMGDVGYLDDQERFWFCGRMAHRVQTPNGTMFTVCCEAIFNQHPRVYRSALVGVGPRESKAPVIIVETWPDHGIRDDDDRAQLTDELHQLALSNDLTRTIERQHVMFHPSLPVDIRHNAKIFREKLSVWAQRKLSS